MYVYAITNTKLFMSGVVKFCSNKKLPHFNSHIYAMVSELIMSFGGYSHDSISRSYSIKHTVPNFFKKSLFNVQYDLKIFFIT